MPLTIRFYRKYGVRGVIGAIDGTHVEIVAPPATDEENPPFVFINRKGRHSMNVMLVIRHVYTYKQSTDKVNKDFRCKLQHHQLRCKISWICP